MLSEVARRGAELAGAAQRVRFDGAAIYAITIAGSGPYPRKLHIAWSRLGGGTPEEIRTKHLWARRYNVYYACSDDGGTTWKRSDGRAYALPIAEADAEKVYDSGEHGVWLKDIQLDSQERPYILFIDARCETYESAWKLLGRADGRWRISDVARSDHMYDDAALAIVADDDLRIYGPTTASQPHEDGGEIEEWTSRDAGRTWRNTRHITCGSPWSHNCVKTVYPRGAGDFRLMWSYGDSTSPPSTPNVTLYFYGEDRQGAEPMPFGGWPAPQTAAKRPSAK